ncbi:MAG: CoA transferase [Anaerolineae bacterium]|nr:CoA transferase [Anaerolineae bacterium]
MTKTMPLSDVRVLDLSRLLPGPYCSRILSDFGAEVIKVEQPSGGDWMRHVPPLVEGEGRLFRALNRGKKSITLDLKAEAGRAVLLTLVQTADVLLESFRPDVMERLGLGQGVLAEVNPGLITCALSGYGTTGPYRERAGHDLGYVSLAGLLDVTGERDGPPVIPGVPVADMAGAMWAAVGILLALRAREQTGRGQQVDGSLLGGALSFLSLAVAREEGGQPLVRGGSDLTGGLVCYTIYQTADGKYVTLSALEPKFWAAFCTAVGREDLVTAQFSPAAPGARAYDDLRALFRSRTRQAWIEAFAEVDACCEPVYTVEEALASAPVQALGMTSEQGLLPPLRFSDQPAPHPGPAPALGQHTAELLAELGYDAVQIEQLRQAGVV